MAQTEAIEDEFWTTDDVRAAIEALNKDETYRLKKAAQYSLIGTEYQDPMELVNEAILRAIGGGGRNWPKSVEFLAFMIMTIRSIAEGSRSSPMQKKAVELESVGGDSNDADVALGVLGLSNPDAVDQSIDSEENQEIRDRKQADVDAIDDYFANDDEIIWIIMGIKDDKRAAEIQEISGMSPTQYESAHRRMRRGLDKLFPGRRKAK